MGLLGDVFEEVSWVVEDAVDTVKTEAKEAAKPSKVKRAERKVRVWKKKYKRATKDFKEYHEKTKQLLKKHYDYKKHLKNEVLKNWVRLMEDSSAVSLHSISNLKAPSLDVEISDLDMDIKLNNIQGFKGLTVGSVNSNFMPDPIPDINLPDMLGLIDDYLYADDTLEDAKDFQAEVESEIEKLNGIKTNLKHMRKRMKEEKEILNNLEIKIEDLIDFISNLKNKQNLSDEEKEKVKLSAVIADAIGDTLNTRFVDDSGTIADDYKAVLTKLNNVEKLIK